MQKKIIALAVAGLVSGAAFAQSNVTIYGIADAGYVNASGQKVGAGAANPSNSFNGIQSGVLAGSRLGFKGEEGLGNGLKAVFTLEYGLDLDQNTGVGSGPAARQQFVGLAHDKLGSVTLGRQYAPGFFTQARNDAFLGSASAGALGYLNAAGGNTIAANSNARWNNSIAYVSPTWSGFTARAIYGYGETNIAGGATGQATGNDGRFGAGLNYANGPLNIDAVYQTRMNTTVVAATLTNPAAAVDAGKNSNVNEWLIAGTYDFKVAKLHATYQKQNDSNGTALTEASNHVYSIGATMPVWGNGKLHANYGRLVWDSRNSGDSDAWAIGYTHAMSKRTTLYTFYTSIDNDRDARGPAGNGTVSALAERNGVFTAGINHTF